jgi:hypothetical protein
MDESGERFERCALLVDVLISVVSLAHATDDMAKGALGVIRWHLGAAHQTARGTAQVVQCPRRHFLAAFSLADIGYRVARINAPFLAASDSGEEFRAGIERAIALGWLWRHESGTCVKFIPAQSCLHDLRPLRRLPMGLPKAIVQGRCSPAEPAVWSRRLHMQSMPRKPIDLPPRVARAFVKDMRAFLVEKNGIKRDEIAAPQLHALRQHYTDKLRLFDVKEMFVRMPDNLD